METLERLKRLSEHVPRPPRLPSAKDVEHAESKLGIKLPPSYVRYQLAYSDAVLGTFEPFQLMEDGGNNDIFRGVEEAREAGVPDHLLPFVEGNSDYYCFALSSPAPEYEVRFWSHNGLTDEKWGSFLAWVDKCWIEEST